MEREFMMMYWNAEMFAVAQSTFVMPDVQR
ncbi:hypothetical protein L861_20255 [Litchfieldella anticariensis FP35 = DSM 16096]|uniref:Uncharacterized protein n=1 Tax=Litchfieldella anticariensis (strain DSM 16096 / CECT 5854 / CIP 108499 / LMG 22089 / FP35) TaxID=1121939 RepID=S2KIN3_LITA3|nr:hypothetical protein L861_20255 [Halomonas anticariensis FP35 = DSM 16096]